MHFSKTIFHPSGCFLKLTPLNQLPCSVKQEDWCASTVSLTKTSPSWFLFLLFPHLEHLPHQRTNVRMTEFTMRLRISSYFPVTFLVYISRGSIKRHICCWHRSTHLVYMYFFFSIHLTPRVFMVCTVPLRGQKAHISRHKSWPDQDFLHFWVSTTHRAVTMGPCWLSCPWGDQTKLKSVLKMSLVAERRQTGFNSRWDAHLKRSKEHAFLFFFSSPGGL